MSKILIVDEDPLIRNLLEHVLEVFEEYGIKLLTAENGMSAIEIIKKEKPVLVFLDVMVPKMNGFEVCNVVKNELETKNIYIIMLSANRHEFDRRKANKIGADFYITKPFSIKEIVKKVGNVIGINLP